MKTLSPDNLKQVEALLPLLKDESAKAQEMALKVIGANPAAANNGKTANITTDIDCDDCGKPMIIRNGKRGKFLGCSGYPKCKNTGDVPAKLLEELGLDANGEPTNGNGATNGKPKDAAKKKPAPVEEIETDLTVD